MASLSFERFHIIERNRGEVDQEMQNRTVPGNTVR